MFDSLQKLHRSLQNFGLPPEILKYQRDIVALERSVHKIISMRRKHTGIIADILAENDLLDRLILASIEKISEAEGFAKDLLSELLYLASGSPEWIELPISWYLRISIRRERSKDRIFPAALFFVLRRGNIDNTCG